MAETTSLAIEGAIERLRKVWGECDCPFCTAKSWAVGNPIVLKTEYPRVMEPCVPVQCGGCGLMVLVNEQALLEGRTEESTEGVDAE